ncbi:anther-specific protein LAT52-like [Papaver somniferum]|uniref:anther-specific protein LAT52-like n=1 Tax=Papaver somniferum TaxID=3469 RepID=UPI000E6F6722|nr:anther-specific protein LAT52-like [Papaver somniferum]
MAVSRVLIVLALCVLLPALIAGEYAPVEEKQHYEVYGHVFCDTCQLGCEHPLSTPVADAEVKIECRDRKVESLPVVFTRYGKTDKKGNYMIKVLEQHKNQKCEAVLVKSPLASCKEIVEGLDRATVILNEQNGIASYKRMANSLGFRRESTIDGCGKLYELYNYED